MIILLEENDKIENIFYSHIVGFYTIQQNKPNLKFKQTWLFDTTALNKNFFIRGSHSIKYTYFAVKTQYLSSQYDADVRGRLRTGTNRCAIAGGAICAQISRPLSDHRTRNGVNPSETCLF